MSRLRHLLLFLLAFACTSVAAEPRRKVFIAGDSTASEYGPERAPRTGWGQVLDSFLDPARFEVRNHARSGRSSRSFIEEGWFDGIASDIGKGDILLIQFGHNDAKTEDPSRYNEPEEAFPAWLMRYVALAREQGATPILITPVARRTFEHGEPVDTHGPHAQAVRELAQREEIGLIDLGASSMDWLRALGEEASKQYYMHVPEQSQADDTHFQMHGALAVACLVVNGWKQLDPSLSAQLIRDTDCGATADTREQLAAQKHPSLVVDERDVARRQPGPHGGAGTTTAHPLFADDTGLPFIMRKRILHPGAGIGLHSQHKDEIYYIISGQGLYTLDGHLHEVGPGHALLTRSGSTHAIRQTGEEDLVLLIVYPATPATP